MPAIKLVVLYPRPADNLDRGRGHIQICTGGEELTWNGSGHRA